MPRRTNLAGKIKPYVIVEKSGRKIAIIGYTTGVLLVTLLGRCNLRNLHHGVYLCSDNKFISHTGGHGFHNLDDLKHIARAS